nr:phospholipase DDHD1 [Hymenolepis microstoma]
MSDAEIIESNNTVSEAEDIYQLSPSKVRWFYKDEVAKKWVPFNGYDSIKIELNYLRLLKAKNGFSSETDDNLKPLVVRDGLYEIDVVTKQCYPIYWESPTGPTTILRGIWFKDPGSNNSVPIEDESMVEQLEITYAMLQLRLSTSQSAYSGSSSPKLGTDEESVYTLKFPDCHVDWYSLDELYLFMEGPSFYIRQKLGMQKVGTRLGRGYFEEADLNTPPPIYSHLCFVVHGMGQKYQKGSIITACDGIRDTSTKLIESYFPELRASEQRVQFLPVEWRNSLRLDGNILDSITLGNLARLRTFLNCTFMDIMYYTSPLYRYEINQSLRLELNRLYCLFCERHPYFESNGGKVSILAHSLGCVISYDLITGWIEPVPYDQCFEQIQNSCESNENEDPSVLLAKLEAAKEVVKCLETQLERRKMNAFVNGTSDDSHSLIFASRLENLFCMGSPLAVYLTLRGVRPGQTGAPDAIMSRSKCPHIYNIFHPADPVAYRLEPLILKHYSSIPPVDIYRCTDASKFPYHVMHVVNSSSPSSSPPIQRHSVSGVC